MHPLIRLCCFVIFALYVSLGQWVTSFIGLSMLVCIWIISKQWPKLRAWQMLKRMRIFYLSILVMFLWFTPGMLILPLLDQWSPTYDGLYSALQRIVALALLVLGVETLLRLSSRQEILAGLYYLLSPLRFFGLDRQRFMVRMALTLELVAKTESNRLIKPDLQLSKKSLPRKLSLHYYLDLLSNKIAEHLQLAHSQAEEKAELKMLIEIPALPKLVQWLFPIIMIIVFVNTERLVT